MIVRGAFLATLLLAPLATALAQQVIVSPEGEQIVIGPDGQPMGMEQPQEAPPPNAPPAANQSPRLERLKKLDFDRRPSAILKARSTPLENPADAKDKDKDKEKKPESAPAPDPPAAEPPADELIGPENPAKAEAEAAKKKAAEEAARKAAEQKAIEAEIKVFQRNVTLGDWQAVKTYLAGLKEDEGKGGYDRLLQSLQQGPPPKPQGVQPQGMPYMEKNYFAPEDVVQLAAAAPVKLANEQLSKLGQILRQSLAAGHLLESFLPSVRQRLDQPGFVLERRQVALVLIGAGEALAAGEFLPSPEQAEKDNDREAQNLLSRHYLARYDKEKKTEFLERAWQVTQGVLAIGEVKSEAKDEALKRAVELAPKLREELGQAWLDESFTKRPERGLEILAAIGTSASLGLQSQPMQADLRLKSLQLQSTAANALLKAAPEKASEWRDLLGVLAANWLREAVFTYQHDDSTSLGPKLQRDVYGNFFYYEQMYGRQENLPAAIKTGPMLDIHPSNEWLALLDPALRPKCDMIVAQLLLKVGEEAAAFPHIEQLAAAQPKYAKDLVDEFLRVWARNHDPNADRNRTNPYMYMYGFEQRLNGIPLTRSKQERNLTELADWVARLKKLGVEVNNELLAKAFTSSHSTAEVYRLETIEKIFGGQDALDPDMLAELIQQMRANLAGVWRDPALQKDKKTNRRPQDIQAEVMRGYELARATVDGALAHHPDSWALCLAHAALMHDENDYAHELKKDSGFSSRREAAFAEFKRAADLYSAQVGGVDKDKETTKVYEIWFYAALGACDLGALNHEKQLAAVQIPRIKEALQALPKDRAERHMDMFTNALFTRMSSVGPTVKFRYVREGLAIVGDHKLAREVHQLYDYYKDLVTEIRLDVHTDGSAHVGHDEPFGVFIDLEHTREIERESGGFAKYLTNQNSQGYFSWNYGRPTEDYRDKFEEAARESLGEHFEVVSITFNKPDTRSKALPEYGWRVTPYAYLLLKPRGPEVDRIPPLRLDLDFLDTTGYAVIPIESAPVPIVASEATGEARPFSKLKLTQTLDERRAREGVLAVEIKATALGLLPKLETLLDWPLAEFDLVKSDDTGASVIKFDDEGADTAVESERTWNVTLRAKEGLARRPREFTFAKPRVEVAGMEQFRYADADLRSVGTAIELEQSYGTPSRRWLWWIPAGLVVLVGAGLLARRAMRRTAAAPGRFQMPDRVTSFTVLGLLRTMARENGFQPSDQQALGREIERLERFYFAGGEGEPPDLKHIAEEWLARCRH